MADCLFCKIANGEVDAEIVAELPEAIAFRDINPKAPTHIQVIPRRHLADLMDLAGNEEVLPAIFELIRVVASSEGVDGSGFRVVSNNGPDAGQEIGHIHFHLLGGRQLGWPPG